MLDDIMVHSATARDLKSFASQPSHAVLITGPMGAGKYTLARRLAAELLEIPLLKLDSHPFVIHLTKQPDRQNITVDAVRELIKALALKAPGTKAIRRIVLVENAHHMNQEAQNALLKSLEEPDEHTVFILTASRSSELLPTVVSRSSKIEAKPIDLASAKAYLKEPETEVEAAWRLSGGQPGLMASLLENNENELKSAVNQAKELLKKDKYHRILELDALSRDKVAMAVFLNGMIRVIQALYLASAGKGKAKQTAALLRAMQLVLDSQEALSANVLARLVALRLALKLPI